MKKGLVSLAFVCAALGLTAQEYLHVDSYWYGQYIPLQYVDNITIGEMSHENRLPNVMAKDSKISIFNEALQLTHLCDSLVENIEYGYLNKDVVSAKYQENGPASKAFVSLFKGYTAFVETDEVFARYGIHTLAELKAYAAQVYDAVYPEDASVSDPTDRRNSLNRFVAYHLLDRKSAKNELTAAGIENNIAGRVANKYNRDLVDIADWYETMMPHSLLKCSSPKLTTGETVFINRRGLQDHADDRGVFIAGAEVGAAGVAENGYYHYISDIIAYDKQTQETVLDEQIIVNNSVLTPEFVTNGLRINNPLDNTYGVCFPPCVLKNIKIEGENASLYYLFNSNWYDVQVDEFMITGDFDLTIKLPPVPAGTYELNMGYAANAVRSISVIYFDDELCDTIDFRISAGELGWKSDEDLRTPEAIAENDMLLFTQGYRKGLGYCYISDNARTLRDYHGCLRRILTTFTTDGKTDHYLRIKKVFADKMYNSQTMIDFFELCPIHLLNEYNQ